MNISNPIIRHFLAQIVIAGALMISSTGIMAAGREPGPGINDPSAVLYIVVLAYPALMTTSITRWLKTHRLKGTVTRWDIPPEHRAEAIAAVSPERQGALGGIVLLIALWIDRVVLPIGQDVLSMIFSVAVLAWLSSFIAHWGALKTVLEKPARIQAMQEELCQLREQLAALESRESNQRRSSWWMRLVRRKNVLT